MNYVGIEAKVVQIIFTLCLISRQLVAVFCFVFHEKEYYDQLVSELLGIRTRSHFYCQFLYGIALVLTLIEAKVLSVKSTETITGTPAFKKLVSFMLRFIPLDLTFEISSSASLYLHCWYRV